VLQTITKDILTIQKGVIVHQTNCRNRMGAGLAFDIRHKWPVVYYQYTKLCNSKFPPQLLGTYQLVKIYDTGLWVANIFGQLDYGSMPSMCYTNYEVVHRAFKALAENEEIKGCPVYIPFGMGSGLAGGNFEIYAEIVEKYTPTAVICKKS
jgi:O-acetyl-ADP-ribose deacetylase (regulator of RNase III)